jgi:hypothetical protein
MTDPNNDSSKNHISRIARQLRRSWRGPASDARVLEAIDLLRPSATGHPLIRLGGSGDGGYLIPDDLQGVTACFSPGVGPVAQFELDLAQIHALPSFMADASVEAPPASHPLMSFDPLFVGAKTVGNTVRLDDWIARKPRAASGDLMLQMDIEGAEYDVLGATPAETLRRFRIMTIEFHGLRKLFIARHLRSLTRIFRALSNDFVVAHLHPNNCCAIEERGDNIIPSVLEVTFLRRDRVLPGAVATRLPHPLDRLNCPLEPIQRLGEIWQPR